jgi:hypothetical protein
MFGQPPRREARTDTDEAGAHHGGPREHGRRGAMGIMAVVLLAAGLPGCEGATRRAPTARSAPPPVVVGRGLGPYLGTDNVPAAPSPPGGLSAAQVPMLVSIGFDDNAYSGLEGSAGTGGVSWALSFFKDLRNPAGRGNPATFDAAPARVTFFLTTLYGSQWQSESPQFVKRAWRALHDDGHELGNHTVRHADGLAYDARSWMEEVGGANQFLALPFNPNEVSHSPDAGSGIGVSDLRGFRTPFLHLNDGLYPVLKQLGFRYDASIEDGFQYRMDGTNFNWPFTLDDGSEVQDLFFKDWMSMEKLPITSHPGIWEMPVYPVIAPPDEEAPRYGIPAGFRSRLKALQPWFDEKEGKITGFDFNLWVGFQMTKAEFLATLKYTFDLRMRGNRAPLLFGAHSDYYSTKYVAAMASTVIERQQAIEELIRYVLSKPEVRVVPMNSVLDWCRNPVSL